MDIPAIRTLVSLCYTRIANDQNNIFSSRIAPVIAAALYLPGIFLSFQSILMYLALSYPNYQGSILAGNDLFR